MHFVCLYYSIIRKTYLVIFLLHRQLFIRVCMYLISCNVWCNTRKKNLSEMHRMNNSKSTLKFPITVKIMVHNTRRKFGHVTFLVREGRECTQHSKAKSLGDRRSKLYNSRSFSRTCLIVRSGTSKGMC